MHLVVYSHPEKQKRFPSEAFSCLLCKHAGFANKLFLLSSAETHSKLQPLVLTPMRITSHFHSCHLARALLELHWSKTPLLAASEHNSAVTVEILPLK